MLELINGPVITGIIECEKMTKRDLLIALATLMISAMRNSAKINTEII